MSVVTFLSVDDHHDLFPDLGILKSLTNGFLDCIACKKKGHLANKQEINQHRMKGILCKMKAKTNLLYYFCETHTHMD